MSPLRTILLASCLVTLVPGASGARADDCAAVDVEYRTAANLELRDTPQGAGNGVYPIGPGRAVVRFTGNDARLVTYEMREHFTIDSKVLFWETHVVTDSVSVATPTDTRGVLEGTKLRWLTPMRGFHSDGTIHCDGSLCGKFGAPPPGTSALHIPPHDVSLQPFVFSADRRTFTMANTETARTEQPKQTAYTALSAREVRRTCVLAVR